MSDEGREDCRSGLTAFDDSRQGVGPDTPDVSPSRQDLVSNLRTKLEVFPPDPALLRRRKPSKGSALLSGMMELGSGTVPKPAGRSLKVRSENRMWSPRFPVNTCSMSKDEMVSLAKEVGSVKARTSKR